jgi:hypothetical protein
LVSLALLVVTVIWSGRHLVLPFIVLAKKDKRKGEGPFSCLFWQVGVALATQLRASDMGTWSSGRANSKPSRFISAMRSAEKYSFWSSEYSS